MRCIISGCKSSTHRIIGVSYFTISHSERESIYKEACRRDIHYNSYMSGLHKNYKICHHHFSRQHYTETEDCSGKIINRRRKSGHKPTQHLPRLKKKRKLAQQNIIHCIFASCDNRAGNYSGSFFRLPIAYASEWFKRSKRSDIELSSLTPYARVCEAHFKQSQLRTQLVGGVTPRKTVNYEELPLNDGETPAPQHGRRMTTDKTKTDFTVLTESNERRKTTEFPTHGDMRERTSMTVMTEGATYKSTNTVTKDEPVDIEIKLEPEEPTTNLPGVSDIEGEELPGEPNETIDSNIRLPIKIERSSPSSSIPDSNREAVTNKYLQDVPQYTISTVPGLINCGGVPGCKFVTNNIEDLRAHQTESLCRRLPQTQSLVVAASTQKINIQTRMRTHTGGKRYRCPHIRCDYSAADRVKLKGHIKTDHPPVND